MRNGSDLAPASADRLAAAADWLKVAPIGCPTLKRYLTVIAGEVNEDVVARTWGVVGRGLACFRGDEIAWRSWVFATAGRAEPAAFAHQSVLARQSPDPDIPR
jgi:hypothetical protein